MTDDDIESMLTDEDEILPSSGFEVSVMEAVHQESVKPPPLAFPWRRALPGMVAALAAFGVATWTWIGARGNATFNILLDQQLRELIAVGTRLEVQWVAIAIVGTILSVFLSVRLMRGPI